MAARTTMLGPGTTRTELLNLPLVGSWLGLVRVGLSTTLANATIHEWLFIWPNMPGNKTAYRRPGLNANNYYNATLLADQQMSRWMAENESLMKITYTSSNPIGVIYETNRKTLPASFPLLPDSPWNVTSTTPWTGTGANTAAGNPTERIAAISGDVNGVVYWKPTT